MILDVLADIGLMSLIAQVLFAGVEILNEHLAD